MLDAFPSERSQDKPDETDGDKAREQWERGGLGHVRVIGMAKVTEDRSTLAQIKSSLYAHRLALENDIRTSLTVTR